MTEPESTTDRTQRAPVATTHRFSNVHQKMSVAGVALGEAHQHLAVLQQTEERPKQLPDDVRVAELKALRQCLEDAREALDRALDRTSEADTETSPEKADPSPSPEPDEGPESPRDVSDTLHWNTAMPTPPFSIPQSSSKEQKSNLQPDP